jgi:hypothetical protein
MRRYLPLILMLSSVGLFMIYAVITMIIHPV